MARSSMMQAAMYGGMPGYTAAGRKLPSAASRTTSSGVSSATRAQVAGLFKEAKAMYAPGGEYMKGIEAQLERGGKKAVATGMQGLAAAGLGGTSMMGGLGLKYEEDVATPARSQATTARLGALSGLLQAEAGATANLATRYSTSPGSYGGGGGGGGYAPARTTSTRRPSTTRQPSTTQQPVSTPPLLNKGPKQLFKEPAPAGQWQGTIGGTDFYSTGTGGYTQRLTPTASTPKKKPFSNYYDVGGELGI